MSVVIGIDKFARNIKRKVQGLVSDKRFLDDLGGFVSEMVRKRTQLGYGVPADGGSRQQLARLSKKGWGGGYVGFRSRFKGLSNLTKPGKSNLTLTGTMLKSIGYEIRGKSVRVVFFGNNPRAGMSNQKLANIHHSGKRPFMFLSRNEYGRVSGFFRRQVDVRWKKLSKEI